MVTTGSLTAAVTAAGFSTAAVTRTQHQPAGCGEAGPSDRGERRGVRADQHRRAEQDLERRPRAGTAEGQDGRDHDDDQSGGAEGPEEAGLAEDRVACEVLDHAGGDRVALAGREAVELLAEHAERDSLERDVGHVEGDEGDQGEAADGGRPPVEPVEQAVDRDRKQRKREHHADVDDLEARGDVPQPLVVADHRVEPEEHGEGEGNADEHGVAEAGHEVSLSPRAWSRNVVVRRAAIATPARDR